jgi:RecA/RadA recombinase
LHKYHCKGAQGKDIQKIQPCKPAKLNKTYKNQKKALAYSKNHTLFTKNLNDSKKTVFFSNEAGIKIVVYGRYWQKIDTA